MSRTSSRKSQDSLRRETADRLHAAAIHLLRRVREADREAALSPARLSVLSVLVFGGAQTPGRLAAIEQVRPPTMTRLVQGLEADKFVRRRRRSTDRRSVVIEATPRGRRVLEAARRRRLDLLAHLIGACSDRELRMLRAAAEIMERAARRLPDDE
jgi:DNA-binding MarR family transcriptional regulator